MSAWNLSGLCSECIQMEVNDLLVSNIDILAGQESWEEDSRINIDNNWFGTLHVVLNSQRREEGVGFLVHNCLVNEVKCVGEVKYAGSVWMKVGVREGWHCT